MNSLTSKKNLAKGDHTIPDSYFVGIHVPEDHLFATLSGGVHGVTQLSVASL